MRREIEQARELVLGSRLAAELRAARAEIARAFNLPVDQVDLVIEEELRGALRRFLCPPHEVLAEAVSIRIIQKREQAHEELFGPRPRITKVKAAS